MLADIILPNSVFDPNAFWNVFFTFLTTATVTLGGIAVAWLNLRAGQKRMDDKIAQNDVKTEEVKATLEVATAKQDAHTQQVDAKLETIQQAVQGVK